MVVWDAPLPDMHPTGSSPRIPVGILLREAEHGISLFHIDLFHQVKKGFDMVVVLGDVRFL